jgi:hypothetical protein
MYEYDRTMTGMEVLLMRQQIFKCDALTKKLG